MNTIHRHRRFIGPYLTTLWLVWATTWATCEGTSRAYQEWSLQRIHATLLEWKDQYPNFVSVTTAQEEYGLPRAGGPDDCPFDEGADGCLNYILRIQDYVAHPVGSESDQHLPSIMWNGEVHGDERVGPTTVMESAALLLEAATCESLPQGDADPASSSEARLCRTELEARGINAYQRRWLARLVSTRRIVVVPASNALGYFQSTRREGNIDPNRDFPIDRRNGAQDCMQSIAARTINEVFRDDMFRIALSYHGGIEVLAYEWGTPSRYFGSCPDLHSQSAITDSARAYAGNFTTDDPINGRIYRVGDMNEVVSPLRGTFEDWSYAASWDTPLVGGCNPATFGGYPPEKMVYDSGMIRAFSLLIEITQQKMPDEIYLGTDEDVLNAQTPGNGHVSRNLRLALLTTDVVEPYLSIFGVNTMHLTNDIVPLVAERDCETIGVRIAVPAGTTEVVIAWTVGGVLEIDETVVMYGPKDDVEETLSCATTQISVTDEDGLFTVDTAVQSGTGFFASEGGDYIHDRSSNRALGPTFVTTIPFEGDSSSNTMIVIARARVDTVWGSRPESETPSPDVDPQSHLAQARVNPDRRFESGGKVVQGRDVWYSIPVYIRMDPSVSKTTEVSNRLPPPPRSSLKGSVKESKLSRLRTERSGVDGANRVRGR